LIVEAVTREISRYDIVYLSGDSFRTGKLCLLPYPNHKHGCPNFGKKEDCPPSAKFFSRLILIPMFLVGVKFDLEKHMKRMKDRHPDWSDRQAKCLLYWQGTVNKALREECEKISSNHPNYLVLYKPEANGVNVFATCRSLGIILERSPKKYVWKIAIMGIARQNA